MYFINMKLETQRWLHQRVAGHGRDATHVVTVPRHLDVTVHPPPCAPTEQETVPLNNTCTIKLRRIYIYVN